MLLSYYSLFTIHFSLGKHYVDEIVPDAIEIIISVSSEMPIIKQVKIMNIKVKTAVIGAGAAGMSAAISAAGKNSGKVIILEKQNKAGRKLLATGNGRCNIGNTDLSVKHYHGDKAIIKSVLSYYTKERAQKLYRSLGLLLRTDSEGRIYPYSSRSDTVLECLRKKLEALSVDIICSFEIKSIKKENGIFCICSQSDRVYAENIIFACGSQAAPHLGADTSGYDILLPLGIKPGLMFPSLCPVPCREKYRLLKGVRAKGRVSLYADGQIIKTEAGEIQFSDTGLSGICIFNISRYVNEFFAAGSTKKLLISVDLMPEYNESDIIGYLRHCKKLFANDDSGLILSAALDVKLSQTIVKSAGLSGIRCGSLSDSDICRLAQNVKAFSFTPSGIGDFKSSQVSAGGFDSHTVDPRTLMCRKIKNLYICGEMLDADGDCGGYNLHFAFGSGMLAADSINK